MKCGLQLAMGAAVSNWDALQGVAALADELNYDSLLMGDHVVVPKHIDTKWPYDEYVAGMPPYHVYTEWDILDPFDTVAFLAAITEKVRVGISVVIVPYRHPFDMARRIATIDVLSRGRFILGVGIGWLEEEFQLLDIPFKERGARTDEYVEVMKTLWTEDKPRYSGRFIELAHDVNPLPQPLQKPYPPIWVGGESDPALKRAARIGNGWHFGLITPEQIRPRLERLKQLMDAAGRDYDKLEITGLVDYERLTSETVRAYRDLGVDVLYILPISLDTGPVLQQMRDYADMIGASG